MGQTDASSHRDTDRPENRSESEDEHGEQPEGHDDGLARSQADFNRSESHGGGDESDDNNPPGNTQTARPEQENNSEGDGDDTPQPSNVPRPRPQARPHGRALGTVGNVGHHYNTRKTGRL